MPKVSVVLIAGGTGTRMQSELPKQYIKLDGKPIALYSAEVFASHPSICELIIVCHPDYKHYFQSIEGKCELKFALPGKRRQDSIYNGFQKVSTDTDIVCTHDAARPFITQELVQRLIDETIANHAATLAVPLKFTIKEADKNLRAVNTPDRSLYWEIQTPQALRKDLLHQGFQLAHERNITVTDDVSLAELIQHPVKLVIGSDDNIKITTPIDLSIANTIIANRSCHG